MVIKGKIRGSGRGLASYLLAQNENEEVTVLDVDGMAKFTSQDLRNLLGDMSLNEQLTKSRQGLYHASINPGVEDSKKMTDADWMLSAEILAKELGFENSRKAIVLHTKLGRQHAHLVFERYELATNKMIPISHNYRKHDRARKKMEEVFNHKATPTRNPHQPKLKKMLTAIWKETGDAKSFIHKAKQQGYMISNGFDKIPFMVVDSTGRSFPLARNLDGIRIKEVRDRFALTVLMEEKEAIALMRSKQQITLPKVAQQATTDQRIQDDVKMPGEEKSLRDEFAENLARIREQQQAKHKGPRMR